MGDVVRQSVFVVPALVAVAQARGSFDAAGLEVETTLVVSSAQQWADLVQGRADVAVTAIDNLFVWNARSRDVVVVAQLETTTLLTLALRPGLADLAGPAVLRLAVDAPDNGFAVVARSMLHHLGRAAETVELVQIGGVRQRLDALLAGTADATLLSPPLDGAAVAAGATVAVTVGEVVADYPGMGFVVPVGPGARAAVRRYLDVLEATRAWVHAAPEAELAELLADQGPSAVAALRSTLPESLVVAVEGPRVLARLRDELGLAVAGAPGPDELLDATLLGGTGR